MRIPAIAVALVLAVGTAAAQRHRITINAETPEGQLLQQIGQEEDEAKKLGLLEQFSQQYPNHEGIGWAHEQMLAVYSKTGDTAKALAIGEKLLTLDPTDAENAHTCLKAAEAAKDPDLVMKWAGLTSEAARKVVAGPKPEDEDEAEEWARRVDFAKQVDVYTEYSLYAMALQEQDPKKKIQLADALEQRNPESEYLPQLAEQRFRAYMQAGDSAQAVALAERLLEKGQSSPEMLLAVAGAYVPKKQPDKVLDLAKKAIEAANGAARPEGVSEADWATWKTQITGRANFVIGVTHAAANRWAQADQALRAALPAVQPDQAMNAEALFYLGLANYRLGEKGDSERIRDALRFSEQCAAIPGRFQAPARQNVKAIRSQYRIQ